MSAAQVSEVPNVGAYVRVPAPEFTTLPPPRGGAAIETCPGGDAHAALVLSCVNEAISVVPETIPIKRSPTTDGVPDVTLGVALEPVALFFASIRVGAPLM